MSLFEDYRPEETIDFLVCRKQYQPSSPNYFLLPPLKSTQDQTELEWGQRVVQ
ncbi:thiamine biosynthesis enzyme [Anopheles sinensis]|uniref:Thiamine biosynthesis enzyme n=1 Tax=Anopheles sinensis TaxID=74873 RepID=A0A084WJW5_ANOSI|nr:thiamine biosynthesis enzyme [Anopheles sinensis]